MDDYSDIDTDEAEECVTWYHNLSYETRGEINTRVARGFGDWITRIASVVRTRRRLAFHAELKPKRRKSKRKN